VISRPSERDILNLWWIRDTRQRWVSLQMRHVRGSLIEHSTRITPDAEEQGPADQLHARHERAFETSEPNQICLISYIETLFHPTTLSLCCQSNFRPLSAPRWIPLFASGYIRSWSLGPERKRAVSNREEPGGYPHFWPPFNTKDSASNLCESRIEDKELIPN
jgi:hypothetical protein